MAKIIIDAGHGGTNPGAVYEGRQEKEDVLRLSLAVGNILENQGVEVAYTRTGDVTDTPLEKAQIANREGGDFLISLHRNSSPQPNQYSGVESLVFDRSGRKVEMAENINRELEAAGFRDLGVKERPGLIILRRTRMPAVLVEVGFLNTDADNALFDENFQGIAQAIANGILATIGTGSESDTGRTGAEEANMQPGFSGAETAGAVPGSAGLAGVAQGGSLGMAGTATVGTAGVVSGGTFGMALGGTAGRDAAGRTGTAGTAQGSMSGMVGTAQGGTVGAGMAVDHPGGMVGAGMAGNHPGDTARAGMAGNHPGGTVGAGMAGNYPGGMAEESTQGPPRLYRVQTGAFRNRAYAEELLYQLLQQNYPAYILFGDGLYRVQVGAYRYLDNAVRMERALRDRGYSTFIAE